MNTEVNYVIAKLLKEKGFDLPTKGFYYSEEFKTEDIKFSDNINHNSHVSKFSSPTIGKAIMWFYEKHGIWISVDFNPENSMFFYVLRRRLYRIRLNTNVDYFKLPTEAYLEAITHVLNNLI